MSLNLENPTSQYAVNYCIFIYLFIYLNIETLQLSICKIKKKNFYKNFLFFFIADVSYDSNMNSPIPPNRRKLLDKKIDQTDSIVAKVYLSFNNF